MLACQDIRNRQAAAVAARQLSEQAVDIRAVAATGQRIRQHLCDYTCLRRIATTLSNRCGKRFDARHGQLSTRELGDIGRLAVGRHVIALGELRHGRRFGPG